MKGDVRTCRACGCWELQACEGGCAWASADRCTACPAGAPKTHPINRHHLEAASFEEVDRDVGAAGQVVTQRMVEFPSVVTTIRTHRAQTPEIHVYVGAMEIPAGNIEMIADLLNQAEAA
tara:strand:- start:26 stop:385 length:360 start_codon:yes stop_codon:yes gene_type:complete